MPKRQEQTCRLVGAYRAMPHAPIAQGVIQHSDRTDVIPLATHTQRHNPDWCSTGTNDQHPHLLTLSEVAPIELKPIERVEERSPPCFGQQCIPGKSVRLELVRIIDFDNVDHLKHREAWFVRTPVKCVSLAARIVPIVVSTRENVSMRLVTQYLRQTPKCSRRFRRVAEMQHVAFGQRYLREIANSTA